MSDNAQPKVKPIVFNQRGAEWWGTSSIGLYVVAKVEDNWAFWMPTSDTEDEPDGIAVDERRAMKAAQRVHDRMVLAALEPDTCPAYSVSALVEALRPFANFGDTLDIANDDRGSAHVVLYAGLPPQRTGMTSITRNEDGELELNSAQPDGCLLGVTGSMRGVAASFMCPVLQVKHFSDASRALTKGDHTV